MNIQYLKGYCQSCSHEDCGVRRAIKEQGYLCTLQWRDLFFIKREKAFPTTDDAADYADSLVAKGFKKKYMVLQPVKYIPKI